MKLFSKTNFVLSLLGILMFSTTALAQTPLDRSLYFDGEDDYIFLNSSAQENYQSITIEAWVKICEIHGTNTIVSKAYCGADRYAYHFYISDGKLTWRTYDSGSCSDNLNQISTKASVIPQGVWTHVAVTQNEVTEECTLYVDGTAFPTTSPNVDIIGTPGHPLGSISEPIRIGLLRPASGNAVGTFHGNMDEFMIFDVAKDITAINNAMNNFYNLANGAGLKIKMDMNKPVMGRDVHIINSVSGGVQGITKNYNNLNRPDQTPFSIYNDTEICCSSSSNRMANPEPAVEEEALAKVVIAPNPNNGNFFLSWPGSMDETAQVEIRDLVSGKLIYKGQVTPQQEINLGSQPVNSMVVTILTDSGKVHTGKMISGMH